MIQHHQSVHYNEIAAQSDDNNSETVDDNFDPLLEDITTADDHASTGSVMEERPSIVNLLYSNNTITADDEITNWL